MSHIPAHSRQAIAWLRRLVPAEKHARLADVPADDFKRSWSAVFFLHPGLHPDNIPTKKENTTSKGALPDWCSADASFLSAPFYVQTGWPVALESLLREAWKRYEQGLLTEVEFYCTSAQRAGIQYQNGAQ